MSEVRFRQLDGSERTVAGSADRSVMQIAVANSIDGIVGECGGNLMCATCHVYVDDDCLDAVGGPGDVEDEMLDMALSPRRANSRLSCQIRLSPDHPRLGITVPPEN